MNDYVCPSVSLPARSTRARSTQPYVHDAAVSLQRQSGHFAPERFPSHKGVPPRLQRVVLCTKSRRCHVFARTLFLEKSSFMAMLLPAPHPPSIPHLQRARQAAQPRAGQSTPSFLILRLAAAVLKDRDLSGSFVSILTNEWINLMY